PFAITDIQALLLAIFERIPDVWALKTDPRLAMLIDRLLMKDPDDRFTSANDALAALQTQTPESPAIRESFLQAARFVGRDAELAALSNALSEAIHGKCSAWLVGGESGVG